MRKKAVVPTPRQGARAFARWYIGQAPIWPMELRRLGTFAMLALQTFDQPRQPYATELIQAEKDLAAFQDAYAAHMASK